MSGLHILINFIAFITMFKGGHIDTSQNTQQVENRMVTMEKTGSWHSATSKNDKKSWPSCAIDQY